MGSSSWSTLCPTSWCDVTCSRSHILDEWPYNACVLPWYHILHTLLLETHLKYAISTNYCVTSHLILKLDRELIQSIIIVTLKLPQTCTSTQKLLLCGSSHVVTLLRMYLIHLTIWNLVCRNGYSHHQLLQSREESVQILWNYSGAIHTEVPMEYLCCKSLHSTAVRILMCRYIHKDREK